MEEEFNATEDLRERTFNFFKNNKIELPIPVDNALSDVFDENDFEASAMDEAINIYFKEDIDSFLTDTLIIRQINTQVKGGNSSGLVLDKYDYYGVLKTKGAETINYALYDGEEIINQVRLVEPTGPNVLDNPADWCIVLIEETEFHMGELQIIPRVYIYVPTSGEGI